MTEERVVERFKMRTVWFHWVHTAAFLILAITGAILFIPGLGGIAAGGWTRILHRISAIIFAGGPIVYFFINPRMSLHFIKETLTWGKNDLGWVKAAPDYYFGGSEDNMPPQPHVNTGQKMWQLVVLGTGVLFALTGLVIWFLRDIVPAGLFQWCIVIHDVAFVVAFVMLLVHIYLGAIHPRMVESFRSILNGKISVTYARNHYGKWYDEIGKKK
ncbi:MAG TPA: cytochrome b/b6 domain-containing protein [Dehalococcoidales bacterium]|nr:cytochrome b/b6 domain-containing protein [Dehalococcoidales bacterium]